MKMPEIDQSTIRRRAKIAKRLRRIVGSEWVLDSEAERRPYECDGLTAYTALPLLVVLPETTAQVQLVLLYCHEERIKVVPRGSGTSLSGGALPLEDAILLVTARMNRILEVDARNRIARVQPGVQNIRVSEAVKHLGLCYMPDPSSQAIATIGGNVAENSGGVHCLKYGVTSNHVTGLKAVLLTGEVVHLGGDFMGAADREFDLTGAVIGSEGLLAVITQITVRLVPQPLTARVLSLGFRSVEDASKCVGAIIGRGVIPAGLEFIDRKVIDAVSSMLGEVHPPDVE
ncbi:MAG TPA: FAD-binding protein, partial [Edaphobacter sp.]|nr:FAD-binding protein [Edaphobacter sp.]